MKNVMPIMNMVDYGDMIKETVDSITTYLNAKEEQVTERLRIEACLSTITKKMEEDREKFEIYMNKSFEERENLYQRLDGLIQASIEKNNIELCKMALNSMLTIYNKNPMEGFEKVFDGVNADLLSAGPKNYV